MTVIVPQMKRAEEEDRNKELQNHQKIIKIHSYQ